MAARNNYYDFLPIEHAYSSLWVNRKVNIIGAILEFGLPRRTRGTDYCCSIRIIDKTYQQTGFTVNIFAENAESLPHIAACGDIIQLNCVTVKEHGGERNAVYNKKYSSFAVYKGEDGDDVAPYHFSSNFLPRAVDNLFVGKVRRWLVRFQLREDASAFPMLREIKEGYMNLTCKILHGCEIAQDGWFIFVWDGTDTPSNAIDSKLEDEMSCPLPLQLESLPLARELLCTLPKVGSILRITFDADIDKNYNNSLPIGKWIKFVNIRVEVQSGLWFGVFAPSTKVRYTPIDDNLILECQRLYDERISLRSRKMPSSSLSLSSFITEVCYDWVSYATLMDVLTHSEVTTMFKCVVRVVAIVPSEPEQLRSPSGKYRMRVTLEDPTARIHALVFAKDGETLFRGYPNMDNLRRKLDRLLGANDDPRNPPWASVCLKSYYCDKSDMWGTRNFRIFDTKIVEEE